MTLGRPFAIGGGWKTGAAVAATGGEIKNGVRIVVNEERGTVAIPGLDDLDGRWKHMTVCDAFDIVNMDGIDDLGLGAAGGVQGIEVAGFAVVLEDCDKWLGRGFAFDDHCLANANFFFCNLYSRHTQNIGRSKADV